MNVLQWDALVGRLSSILWMRKLVNVIDRFRESHEAEIRLEIKEEIKADIKAEIRDSRYQNSVSLSG